MNDGPRDVRDRVKAVVDAIDSEHIITRYCREDACEVCSIIERVNGALA